MLHLACLTGKYKQVEQSTVALGDLLCIWSPNTGQLNPLFHTFAESRLIVNRVVAQQSTGWLAANAQFSLNDLCSCARLSHFYGNLWQKWDNLVFTIFLASCTFKWYSGIRSPELAHDLMRKSWMYAKVCTLVYHVLNYIWKVFKKLAVNIILYASKTFE